MRYLFLFIVSISVFSCTTKNDDTTYFGGEIVNPRTNFVLFLKEDTILDTITLNNENRFLTQFKNLEEGLYTFKHGLEFQYIYLEPTDSVLVRFNTWDFDESMVFSGKGSSKNEFLLSLFLENEKEEKAMYKYFRLEESPFQAKIDSLKLVKENIYKAFESNEDVVSEGFINLTNSAINLPLFRLKEIYPLYYKKVHNSYEFPKVSQSFYNYRNNIDLNQNNLLSFYPYQNYIVNYLYNIGYETKENDSTKNNITINVLNALVENIQSEEIKNTLLKRIVVNDFLKSGTTCSINNEILDIFLKNCTNEDYLNQVNNLVNDSKFVKNEEKLPNFDLVNYNDKSTDILNVIDNQKAVIYFWSTEYMSADYLVSRIRFLERKFPNIDFIGVQMQPGYINISTDPTYKSLAINNQFKLTSNSFANQFLTSHYPRIIIVNDNNLVMNGFTYLDSKSLTKELKKL